MTIGAHWNGFGNNSIHCWHILPVWYRNPIEQRHVEMRSAESNYYCSARVIADALLFSAANGNGKLRNKNSTASTNH